MGVTAKSLDLVVGGEASQRAAKMVLVLSLGLASVEHGFSVNKEVEVEN